MAAPPGSKPTRKGQGGEDADSDLNNDLYSDQFNLAQFNEDGVYGRTDLGFKMPKTVVTR